MRRMKSAVLMAMMLTLIAPGAGAQETIVVEAQDNIFAPAQITIKAGDSIEFRNTGIAPHTAQDKAGSFNTGNLNSGQSQTVRFQKAGTFQLICLYHESVGMVGTITVEGSVEPASATAASPSASVSPAAEDEPSKEAFDPDAGVPIGMKIFPYAAGGMLLLLLVAIGLGYIRNVQKTSES